MTYRIFKGFHFCFPLFTWGYRNKTQFSKVVTFDSSAIYDIGVEQSDINKLWGIRDAFFSNHKNSARFGWRYAGEGMIELLAYCYDKGVRLNTGGGEVSLGFVKPYESVVTEIFVLENKYIFRVGIGSETIIEQVEKATLSSKWYFTSNPYFGGNLTAPHTIKIKIK